MQRIWCDTYTCLIENENIADFGDSDNMKTKMSDYGKNDMKSLQKVEKIH